MLDNQCFLATLVPDLIRVGRKRFAEEDGDTAIDGQPGPGSRLTLTLARDRDVLVDAVADQLLVAAWDMGKNGLPCIPAALEEGHRARLERYVGGVLEARADARVATIGSRVEDREPLDAQLLLDERQQRALTTAELNRKWKLVLEGILKLQDF